jgi:TonB family protein
MLRTNDDQIKNLRNPELPDERTGIARPPRTSHALFAGWGPKLLIAALAITAVLGANQPASAATKVIALATCGADHGAVLLSHPDVILPDLVSGTGETIMRVDLGTSGEISNLSIAQSSGDAVLDFAAMRVARGSRYQAASWDCQSAGESVLYRVIFDQ